MTENEHPVKETEATQRANQDLPEDATVEDAMEHLYFLAKVERGLVQSEGETIPHEEIKARFSTTRHYAEGVR